MYKSEQEAAKKIRAVLKAAALETLRSGRFPRSQVFDDIEKIIDYYSKLPALELRRKMGITNPADRLENEAADTQWEAFGKDIARMVRSGRLTQAAFAEWLKEHGKPASWAREYFAWVKNLSPQRYGALGAARELSTIAQAALASKMATPQRVIKQSIAVTGTGERVTYTAQMVHRYNLSGAVWKSVEYAQAKILDVIDGGRAMARDGVQIAKDLEILTGSSDGGRRVKGRWGRLAPDSLLEKRTTLIAETKGYGTFDFAKMKEARKEAMSELRKEGWVMGQEAKQYYQRLGAAGADYRALRVERTETQFMLKDEAQRDAGAAGYAIKWTLVHTGSPDDDCDICRDYAHGIVGGRQVGTKDGVYRPADLPEIPHPNCDCIPQPVPMPEELARPVK